MLVVLHVLAQAGFIIRVLLRPHRDPTSRIAWIVVILAFPLVGMVAYLLLGETNIGRRRAERVHAVAKQLPGWNDAAGFDAHLLSPDIPGRHLPLFRVGQSISGYGPVGGNRARLMPDSNGTIDSLVADIDSATRHVHLLFYIWLPDTNGCKVVEALKRAAGRGVTCRAMVDDLGSRAMIHSRYWAAMQEAGVRLARALPVGNPFLHALAGRIDLRNHRKIVVIDNEITYCGSQNCADPEFRVKAKYAPWMDAVMRFEGAIARQNQHLFAGDWMAATQEDICDVLREPQPASAAGLPAQVVAVGPTLRASAMPEMFTTLIFAARRELVITTPYFAPTETIPSALCAAANRGVSTTIVFPARNDDWAVAATSRSYYADLLSAGVRIYEFPDGLLHTKSLTLDGEVTFIGSANMDRRSFDLNYENNILLYDPDATAAMRERQEAYIGRSRPVKADEVAAWSPARRLLNNAVAVVGPVL